MLTHACLDGLKIKSASLSYLSPFTYSSIEKNEAYDVKRLFFGFEGTHSQDTPISRPCRNTCTH